jgi:hypothetical protein
MRWRVPWYRDPKQPDEYLSSGVIAKLLNETAPGIKPPEVKHFQFVVILADETDPRKLPPIISAVMDTLVQHHATVIDIVSSLVVGVLGVPFPDGNSPEARRELVDVLLREHSNQVKMAHGECGAPVGMFGGQKRKTYGAFIPGFSDILKKLSEAKFGSAIEISQ